MMQKAGKITRLHKALRIELEAREGATLVIGAGDTRDLIGHGATAPIYAVVRTTDVDTIERVGSAYMSRSGKGIALRIDVGMPVLPTLYASKAQVEDVYRGFRSAAGVSTPEDFKTATSQPAPTRRTDSWDSSRLKRGFGDGPRSSRRTSSSPSKVIVC